MLMQNLPRNPNMDSDLKLVVIIFYKKCYSSGLKSSFDFLSAALMAPLSDFNFEKF